MKNKHIVLAGGSGFVGQQMATKWAVDNRVTILTRNLKHAADNTYGNKQHVSNVEEVLWDGRTTGDWVDKLEGCDMLINLAGRSVNCRYNKKNRAEIMDSRVDAVNVLGEAVNMLQSPPELFINLASATIYRHAEDRPQDEATGEIGSGFSVEVSKAWEATLNNIPMPQTRKVNLRLAIVLGKGGVLIPYSFLARLGVGGKHGNGRQMFSWIHIADVIGIAEWLLEHREQQGTYNAASPRPVTNAVFMKTLRDIYKMPVGIPAPKWLLEIAAVLHGTETELLLKSRWVVPKRLLDEGYVFRYGEIKEALAGLLETVLAKGAKSGQL